MSEETRIVQRQRQQLERLGAVEAEIFDTLQGKRVLLAKEYAVDFYTGVLSKHGLEFIQLTDVNDYSASCGMPTPKVIFLYEIRNEGSIADHHVESVRKYRSRIIAKNKINEIYELDDIGLK